MPKVSVIIPSRNEPFLTKTIQDVLRQSVSDVEVIAVLDGWWPAEFVEDPRVHYHHFGAPKGLRPSLNAGFAIAKGDYLLKIDGHVGLAKGFDEVLMKACGDGEIAVPEKYSLNPDDWSRFREPWRHFFYLWPWQVQDDGTEKFVGLQDRNYDPSMNAELDAKYGDNIVAYQGSAWMVRRKYWDRLMPNGMDPKYYLCAEPVEVGMRAIMSGGRCKIVPQTWYSHLHKGKTHKRQFKRLKDDWNNAMAWAAKHWMTDSEPGMTRTFASVVEQFGPFPTWPINWHADAAERWS